MLVGQSVADSSNQEDRRKQAASSNSLALNHITAMVEGGGAAAPGEAPYARTPPPGIKVLPEMLRTVKARTLVGRVRGYLLELYRLDIEHLPIRTAGAAFGWTWSADSK